MPSYALNTDIIVTWYYRFIIYYIIDATSDANPSSGSGTARPQNLCAGNPWPTRRRNPGPEPPPPAAARKSRRQVVMPVARMVGFYLISKVFRPEFEARRIEHRTGPDSIAQTGPHSTA